MVRSLVTGSLCLWSVFLGFLTEAYSQENINSNPILESLQTVAEKSEFKATARAVDVELFLKTLAKSDRTVELFSAGKTVEGRDLWCLNWNVKQDNSRDRLVVLLLGSIHPGESDGKEALLALARDLLKTKNPLWQKNLSLLFLPNYNVDGGERVGKNHRLGQKGPVEGMGIRENAQGLDLNRDFVKLESPEANSLIRLIQEADVDVLIDCHTTNGSLHRYELTYSTPHNPAGPTELQEYLRTQMMPAVTVAMKNAGYNSFWYGNFAEQHKKWESFGHEPRYSTEYMGLRGKIGILSESYSYAEYKTRIEATHAFVTNCLNYLAENREAIQKILASEFSQWSKNGISSFEPPAQKSLAIQAKLGKWDLPSKVLGYEVVDESGKSNGGTEELAYYHRGEKLERLQPKEYEVELWTKVEPTLAIDVPLAYSLSAEQSWIVDRLLRHGVKVYRVETDTVAAVANHRIKKVSDEMNFQDHRLWKIEVESLPVENSTLPTGSFLIPTSQPLGRLITYILEPHSDDSLAKWNFFDPAIREGSVYPVQRIVQFGSFAPEKIAAVESVSGGEKLSLEKIFSGDGRVTWAAANAAAPRWLPKAKDGATAEYVIRRDSGLIAIDAATGSSRKLDLIDKATAALKKVAEGEPSENGKVAIGLENFDKSLQFAMINHRRDLYVYDASTDQAKRVTATPDKVEQLAELSPTGKAIAYVEDNNLVVVDVETGAAWKVTEGNQKDLLNGILDWVYQEEIYGRGNFKAHWWSPDGTKIAFLQLNEKPVDRYPIDDSLSFRSSVEETRYPKAGDALPDVKLFIASMAEKKVTEVDLSSYPADDRLVVRVGWRPDSSKLVYQVQNRIQTWLDICEANVDGSANKLLRETSPAWVDVIDEPRWLPNGDFIWLSDQAGGRRHVYRISSDGQSRTAITEGDWDVTEILWVSDDGGKLILQGNYQYPTEAHTFVVDAATRQLTRLTVEPGTHRCEVDPSGKFFMDRHSRLDSPSRLDLKTAAGELVRTLSATTIDRYKFLQTQAPLLTTIPARDGMQLQAMIIAPPGVDLSKSSQKYPVLFHVYGGPQAPTIANRFQEGNYWWHQYLAQEGYVVVLCDNRASRGPGGKETWPIHRNLGEVELRDLEDAANWVGQQPWGDPNRLGVWGWSYGGYFSGFALTHSKLFRVGIAGAPVTDWRNYDAIYTERYMDTPQNNPEGYKKSSVVEAAGNTQGRLLIIHGEIDDNVHMSNSLQLAHALQKAGKSFDMMIYPRNRHGVVEPQQRWHMYQMMTDFLNRHLRD